MPIKAIYFDLGGVIVRTGDKTSRTALAAEFGMTYDEVDKFVFECETAMLASIGKMTEEAHWLDVTNRLSRASVMRFLAAIRLTGTSSTSCASSAKPARPA
jgi:hypothetical protein